MIYSDVSEGLESLLVVPHYDQDQGLGTIASALRRDQVALIREVSPPQADCVVAAIADHFGLLTRLELQATFASIKDRRQNVGKFFMSVDERGAYQFIVPHSEGNAASEMQLGTSYAYGNTTDGGLTVLQHTDSESAAWSVLREVVQKIDLRGRTLSMREIAEAKVRHSIKLPESLIGHDDEILIEIEPLKAGTRRYKVLAPPAQTHSVILKKDVNAYWASIAGPDWTSTREYAALLHRLGLLKEPPKYDDVADLDGIPKTKEIGMVKAWTSGVKFSELFNSRLVLKLERGDLLIFNNMTWTHAATNWTPGSGFRDIVAAFA